MRAALAAGDNCHQGATSTRWRFFFLYISIILVGGFHVSPALAQTVTQCQENEMLLEIQVSYQPTDISEYLDISIQGPRLPTRDANQSNFEIYSYWQRLMENGTAATESNLSLCVPDDQCLQVVAKLATSFPVYDENYRYQLPPDDIFIVYNGQVWSEKKGPFAYSIYGTMVVAELGPCEVVCESEEALLEIEAVTGCSSEYDWQILDDSTDRIIRHCTAPFQNTSICYWEREQYYHERLCLPRGGCYTLLVGEHASDFLAELDAKFLTVYFDGEHIESFEYLQFINVAFSDGPTVCDATYCDSDSSLVELYFFIPDFDMEVDRNLSWSLSTVGGSLLPGDLGMGTITSDDRAFNYHRECIPKVDYCIRLSTSVTSHDVGAISSPFGFFNVTSLEEGDHLENITFRLAVDGIIYSDYDDGSGYTDDSTNGAFELTHYAGDCSVAHLCGNNSEFYVFQVDFVTDPLWQTAAVMFQVTSRSAVQSAWIDYNLAPFYPDQKYRFFSCLHEFLLLENNPDPGFCTEFTAIGPFLFEGTASFNISIDGTQYMGQQTAGTRIYYGTYGEVTRLAGQCEVVGSSDGPRVGVIVVCAIVVAMGGLVYWKLQTKGDQSTRSRPPPTGSPEATAIAIPIVDDEQYPRAPWKNTTSVPTGSVETTAIAIPIFEEEQREAPISCTILTPQGCEGTHSGSNDNAVSGSVHDAQA